MRRHESLPPNVARELEDLEAALAGRLGADPELLTLAQDVRAARCEPDPAFLASLDAHVLAGFAHGRSQRHTSWRDRLLRPRIAVPVLGVVASVLIAIVLVSGGSGDRNNIGPASHGASSPESSLAQDSGSQAAEPTIAPAPQPSPAAGRETLTRNRRVERSAALELISPPNDVQDVADGVIRTTQSAGGYVANSQIDTRADGASSASFTLRLPSARLNEALANLSKLAHVGALTQNSTDITAASTSVQDRLRDARDERRALLRALGRATTDQQIESLRARLGDNRARISSLDSQQRSLKRRSDLTTVNVQVVGAGQPKPGDAWTPGDALHDAGRVLEVVASVALVGLAVVGPLAFLALLVVLGRRGIRRRRRDAALDGA